MTRRRAATLVAAGLAAAIASAGAAAAASLAVTSGALSIYSVSGSPPVSSCSLTAPSADTYVDEPATENYGTLTTLQTSTRLLDAQHTFVRFALSSCSPAVPAGSEIRSAKLSLYLFDAPATSHSIEVRRVTSAWGETTADWLEQPSVAGSATTSFATGTTDNLALQNIDVRADVQAFVDGTTDNGWRLKPASDGQGLSQFHSREHADPAKRPMLTITYYP